VRIEISAPQTCLNSLSGALEPPASGASKNVACSHSSKAGHAFYLLSSCKLLFDDFRAREKIDGSNPETAFSAKNQYKMF